MTCKCCKKEGCRFRDEHRTYCPYTVINEEIEAQETNKELINWNYVRIEMAKAALQGLFANTNTDLVDSKTNAGDIIGTVDAVIDLLKRRTI